jgi:WD40 repeat protein/serine/threonine protein kinase
MGHRTEEPMADDLCGRTLGEFVLREKLAEGGCGTLYRCYQPSLKREAVVKVLRELRRGNKEAEERFLREAQLASRLDHHYAAHVYAFGVEDEDGLRWIAMELVQGITLDQWLCMRGPMPLEQFVPLFECIAEVVQAAHESGIVHRDLKPANVMVIERAGRLIPKLLDFGIAKLSRDATPSAPERGPDGSSGETHDPTGVAGVSGEVTGTDPKAKDWTPSRAGIGSSAYMSPEQWDDPRSVGPASDIYALGVLAYKALTGRVPFTAQSPREWRQQHLLAKVPPLGGDLPATLDRIFQRALAKTPEDRHRTALDLGSELRAALMASERELLRSLAQHWDACARPPALLLSGEILAGVERWTRRAPSGVLSKLECSYVSASHRRLRRSVWVRRIAGALAATIVLGAFLNHWVMETRLAREQARSAERVAEATATQAALEQGRASLLHGEPDAPMHLAEAYRRGDRSPSTAFMLARALQPRLAEQARLASSAGRMWSAAFSPNGAQIATTDDENAQVWDAQTYRLLFTLRHGDTVYRAEYSLDGSKLVTACGDGTVRIWDAASGTLVRELRRNGTKRRYALVALSPDSKLVAAMDLEVAHVWDAGTGEPLAELVDGTSSGSPSLAFSSDGDWLAMSSGNNVHVFDAETWKQVLVISGPGIDGQSWDPNGPRLLTGSTDGDVSIWAIPTGQRVHHLRHVGEPVDAVAFSPDGRLVVAASRDGNEQIWNAATGKLRSQGNYLRSKIRHIEFDPTSTLVVAAGTSGAVAVADAAQGMLVSVLDGPRNVVMVAHFDRSSQRVVGASWDGTARIWNAGAPYHRWGSPPVSDDCGLVTSLEPDQRILAVGCKNHPTRVWDTARDQLLAELPSVTPTSGDFASAFPAVSTTGDRAAIARGKTVEVFDLPSGRLLRTIVHPDQVNTVAFSTTGRDIISGAVDGTLLVTRDNGAVLTLPASSGGIDAAGFLPDGRLVAADSQRRLRIYDPAGAVLTDLETTARVRTLRMSSDSRRLVTVPSFMGKAAAPELWNLDLYRLVAKLKGEGQAYSARFVRDQVLTAWGDGAARLWDGATGQLRQTYIGGSRFLVDVTMSPDGSMLVGGGGDGLLRFWDADTGRPLWTLPAHKSHLVGVRVDGDDIVTRGFLGDISRWTLPKPERVFEACRARRCVIVPK